MIFCYEDYPKTIYVWIDGICSKTKKRIIYGPLVNWKQAVSKGDEIFGRGNYNLYHTICKTMRDVVVSLNHYGKVQ